MKFKVILSGMAGNILEIYDISIYGFFAPYFALNFFGNNNHTTALIKTFAVFFIGFLARPIGAALFGKMGDKHGRRKTLSVSILLMAISTGLIAFLPTYQQVGMLAPLLLLLMKILQGISVGAEYTGSIIFLSEHAPQKQKLYWSSFAVMAINCGTLFAGFSCYLMESHFSKQSMISFGWRIPYLIAFLGGIAAFYIRYHTSESDEFTKNKNHVLKNTDITSSNKKKLWAVVFLTLFGVTANYLFSIFVVTWMSSYLGYSL
ncbi:MAG TPA: MFS transporter, partial [Coxiellaceae bacterium]|nr:MFS transporter [Coxiellaceae bacterium]